MSLDDAIRRAQEADYQEPGDLAVLVWLRSHGGACAYGYELVRQVVDEMTAMIDRYPSPWYSGPKITEEWRDRLAAIADGAEERERIRREAVKDA